MDEDEPDDSKNESEIEAYINCCIKHSLKWFGKPLCRRKDYYCKYSGMRDEETGLSYCGFYYVKRKKNK